MAMDVKTLIESLQREIEKRGAVDVAAAELARALGMMVEDDGLHALERTLRELPAETPREARLRPVDDAGKGCWP
jgi:hypothetical protein